MKFNKNICVAGIALGIVTLMAACGKQQTPETAASAVVPAEPFSISLVPEAGVDSATRSALIYVAVNDHFDPHADTLPVDIDRYWRLDSLRPDAQGRYRVEGASRNVAEVYVLTPSGRSLSFFAAGGGNYEWTYDNKSVVAGDSLNGWLRETLTALTEMSADSCKRTIDSICRADNERVRSALLVREVLPTVGDTLFLRRCLGHLTTAAKPAWLMYDIDHRMDERYRTELGGALKRNFKFTDSKGETFNFSTLNRSDQLVFFWADYDPASVAALHRLEKRSDKIKLLTFCLHAADSASWRKAVANVPDRHVWLADGLHHPLLRAWGVERPGLYLLLNASARVLYRGTDEKQLTHAIDSIPASRLAKPKVLK